MAKYLVILLCVSFHRFHKTEVSFQLNSLENIIDRSRIGWCRQFLLVSIVDSSIFDGDRVLIANYVYSERHHEILIS